MSTICQLVRNKNYLPYHRPTESQTLEVGTRNLQLNKPFRSFWWMAVWKPLVYRVFLHTLSTANQRCIINMIIMFLCAGHRAKLSIISFTPSSRWEVGEALGAWFQLLWYSFTLSEESSFFPSQVLFLWVMPTQPSGLSLRISLQRGFLWHFLAWLAPAYNIYCNKIYHNVVDCLGSYLFNICVHY